MNLTDAIKPNVKKKFKTCTYFKRLLREGKSIGRVLNKTKFVSFLVRFVSGNKKIVQKKKKIIFLNVYSFRMIKQVTEGL